MQPDMTNDSSLKSKTINCPNCGSVCSARAIVCKSCGHMLREINPDTTQTAIMPRPAPQTEIPPDDDVLGGTSRFSAGSVLYVSIERVNSPIARYVHREPIILGREEDNLLGRNDINLTPYNAKERGVSRRHAQIYYKGGELFIEDLGSSNGTAVNGSLLTKNEPQQLRDGDEIVLGHMMVWVNF